MAETSIEWATDVWNPSTGCDRVSPGCDHCYALTLAKRLKGMGSAKYQRDGDPRTSGPGFGLTVHADTLDLPLRWKRPRRVFVNSMSDLFHDDIPTAFIAEIFAVMALAPQHTFQVLTKRHGRMRSLLSAPRFPELVQECIDELYDDPDEQLLRGPWPPRNVWLGVSVENQQWADIRIPALLDTPAAVRWISAEPLLGPVDVSLWLGQHAAGPAPKDAIDWCVVGGESGPSARPMHPEWARSLRDQCFAAGVPFFFKQHGEWAPGSKWAPNVIAREAVVAYDNGEVVEPPERLWQETPLAERDRQNRRGWAIVHRAGKRAAGRELDGRTWDEYPATHLRVEETTQP